MSLKEDLLSHDDCVRGNAIDDALAQIVSLKLEIRRLAGKAARAEQRAKSGTAAVVKMRAVLKQTRTALSDAKAHLDFIGWGDSYERSCARSDRLPVKIDEALNAAEELVK